MLWAHPITVLCKHQLKHPQLQPSASDHHWEFEQASKNATKAQSRCQTSCKCFNYPKEIDAHKLPAGS